jgi:hypothetical protein
MLIFMKITSVISRVKHEAFPPLCVNFMGLIQRTHLWWQLTFLRGDSKDVRTASLLQCQLNGKHFSSVGMHNVRLTSSSVSTTGMMGESELLEPPRPQLLIDTVVRDGDYPASSNWGLKRKTWIMLTFQCALARRHNHGVRWVRK